MGSLSVLAAGVGVGAALAAIPGTASAGTNSVDGGAGALGVIAAFAAADVGDAAVAGIGAAGAITPPTLPDDYANFAISFSGIPLYHSGTATASSSFGNIAIAHGDFADANAVSGFFNYASAEGDRSVSIVGDTGWFDYASAVGSHSTAIAAYGSGNVATATGDNTSALAGASVVSGVYDSNNNTATAEGLGASADAGWDGSSNNVASAIGDGALDYSPDAPTGAATDFWADLLHLFS